jgi:Mrp family chromosome partitioning ATPase
MAGAGLTVLLVDLDLQHPSVAQALSLPAPQTPLAEAVRSGASVDRILAEDPATTLKVLSFPPGSASASDLVGSPDFNEFFAAAARNFDFVVLDAPAVLEAADAVSVCLMANVTVLIVKAESTPRGLVSEATRVLAAAGLATAGIVVNGSRPLRKFVRREERRHVAA